MARIEDIPEPTRTNVLALPCMAFETTPWVTGRPLKERRVAIVTSAALHHRSEPPFPAGFAGARELPATLAPADIVMSHVSVNFDRSGWQRDINVVYPTDRLAELAVDGVIGSVAGRHYSVMGASDPNEMPATADQIAARMKEDGVNAAIFSPV